MARRRKDSKMPIMSNMLQQLWPTKTAGTAVTRSTQIRVDLNTYALGALEEASQRGTVTRTDVMNRALLVYAALQRLAPRDEGNIEVEANGEKLWICFG
jgi:hypothetical protein